MKILVTNDDGIFAEGLWTLVKKLRDIAEVVVVAPDREQSAIGTAVSLRRPLRIRGVRPLVADVETYSVEGTPGDSVILALSKLVESGIDMVVSGINDGPNLGDDVLISGTVSGALQGYLRGIPAIALSVDSPNNVCMENASKLAALLAKRIGSSAVPSCIFLNINLPDLPLAEIRGAKITKLARYSHTDTVEEGSRGKWKHYWLVRQRRNKNTDEKTDVWAIEQGYISITPLLYTNSHDKTLLSFTERACSDLIRELRQY